MKNGYTFAGWNTAVNGSGTSFAAASSTTITAAITLYAQWTALPTYTIIYNSGGNGTLTGNTSQTINPGASATAVTAVPATGYHFVNWTGTIGFITTTANPLIVNNVTSAQTITANFAHDPINGACGSANGTTLTIIPTTNLCVDNSLPTVTGTGPWNWDCDGQYSGSTEACSANIQTWTIAASAGIGGDITPKGNVVVSHGSSQAFSVDALSGYTITKLTVDSVDQALITVYPLLHTGYTFSNVTANHTISAIFSPTTVNGLCGSADKGTFSSAPINNLCSTGTASTVSGTGPWSWSCTGSNGGGTSSCTALKLPEKSGDCDGVGSVSIAEVQSAINMFLGIKTPELCVDQDGVDGVTISEVQKVINGFLGL